MPEDNKSADEQHQKLHFSKDSSGGLDSKIRSTNSDHGMRVGSNYQAEIPQFIAYAPAPEYYEEEKAIKVWSPFNKIPEHILDEFIAKAKEKFFYNMEQALGMLSWHKFDIARAYADLPNFVPYPNEWSVEDKVLFEQAYQFHEKQFQKIRQMLPDKSMPNLISYYYSWKKTRTRASLMERQTRRFASRKNIEGNADEDGDEDDENDNNHNDNSIVSEENISGEVDDEDADDEEKRNSVDQSSQEDQQDSEEQDQDIVCCLCNKELRTDGKNLCVIVDPVVEKFCIECYLEWRENGRKSLRKHEIGDCYYQPVGGSKRRLFSYQDVVRLVQGTPDQGELMLKQLDTQIEDTMREIQSKKQKLSFINDKIKPIAEQIFELDMNEFSDILPEYKPTKAWTSDETALVLQALRRYGTDFSAIADVMRTKSAESIKTFFVTQKDRLNLELLIQDYEKTKAASKVESNDRCVEYAS